MVRGQHTLLQGVQYADLPYFVGLATLTIYIGAHRGLSSRNRQQLSMQQVGMLTRTLRTWRESFGAISWTQSCKASISTSTINFFLGTCAAPKVPAVALQSALAPFAASAALFGG